MQCPKVGQSRCLRTAEDEGSDKAWEAGSKTSKRSLGTAICTESLKRVSAEDMHLLEG